MSRENLEVVRKPLRVGERSSRTLDERLSLVRQRPRRDRGAVLGSLRA